MRELSTQKMDYLKAESYLYDLSLHGTKLGLANITQLLDSINNPHKKLVFIHIAGTNGKGSVCAILNSILTQAGFKVGVFTSPHLISLRERFKINNRIICIEDFISTVKRIKPAIESLNKKDVFPTFFEAVTAMAADYFLRKNVDVVIWETGLGGSYDSTNIVDSLISAITNVGLDHCQYLGNTLEKIARDKAGIIKENSIFCTASNNKKIIDIFKNICLNKNTKFVLSDKRKIKANKKNASSFDYISDDIKLSGLTSRLDTDYQWDNISLSITIAYEYFKKSVPGIELNRIEKYIMEGLKKAKIQGRFQLVQDNPPVIVDPAHNPPGFIALRDSLLKKYPSWKYIFVFGILSDKDYEAYTRLLAPIAHTIYCVEPKSKRRLPAIELTKCCVKHATTETTVYSGPTLYEILKRYNYGSKKSKELLVICGSFYLVGETLKLLKKTRLKIFDKETDYR